MVGFSYGGLRPAVVPPYVYSNLRVAQVSCNTMQVKPKSAAARVVASIHMWHVGHHTNDNQLLNRTCL
jgi:hypothetical protein